MLKSVQSQPPPLLSAACLLPESLVSLCFASEAAHRLVRQARCLRRRPAPSQSPAKPATTNSCSPYTTSSLPCRAAPAKTALARPDWLSTSLQLLHDLRRSLIRTKAAPLAVLQTATATATATTITPIPTSTTTTILSRPPPQAQEVPLPPLCPLVARGGATTPTSGQTTLPKDSRWTKLPPDRLPVLQPLMSTLRTTRVLSMVSVFVVKLNVVPTDPACVSTRLCRPANAPSTRQRPHQLQRRTQTIALATLRSFFSSGRGLHKTSHRNRHVPSTFEQPHPSASAGSRQQQQQRRQASTVSSASASAVSASAAPTAATGRLGHPREPQGAAHARHRIVAHFHSRQVRFGGLVLCASF